MSEPSPGAVNPGYLRLVRLIRQVLTSCTVGLLAVAAVASAPARAATTAADVTLTGVGAGHGIGLSQHGARARAGQGADAQSILAAYYPGAALSAAPTRPVRVVLTRYDSRTACTSNPEAGEPCLSVQAEPGQRFVNTASGGTVAVPTQLGGQPVTAAAVGAGPVGLRLWVKAGSWQQLEGGTQFTGPVDITSADGAQTAVFSNGQSREYRGALRVARVSATTIHRINVVSMEDYLLGVVPDEMPALWPDAAVQAQGVAASTFASEAMARAGSRSYDLCDTTSCQVYGGVTSEHPSSTAKLQGSPLRGRILTSNGSPIAAFFSSSNGGHSVDGRTPYLPARPDSADPQNTWSRTVPGACMQTKYPGRGTFTGVTVLARDGRGAHGGRVTQLRLDFTGGSVTVGPGATPMATDSAVRQAFTGCGATGGLSSSLFQTTGAPAPRYPSGSLTPGGTLSTGQSLASGTGQHSVAVTGDGFRIHSRTCPAQGKTGAGAGRLVMQADGNLVFYGAGVWSSGTQGNPGAYARMQDDANLVVYSAGGTPLWNSGTVCTTAQAWDRTSGYVDRPRPAQLRPGDAMYSSDRRTRLVMQGDGNLVLYSGAGALWNSRTAGNRGAYAVLQTDGNLVLYSAGNRPLWNTATMFPANGSALVDAHLLLVHPDRVELRGVTTDSGTGARTERVLWRS